MSEFVNAHTGIILLISAMFTAFLMIIVPLLIKTVKWKKMVFYGSYAVFLSSFSISLYYQGEHLFFVLMVIPSTAMMVFLLWKSYKFCDSCGKLNSVDYRGENMATSKSTKKCKKCAHILQ